MDPIRRGFHRSVAKDRGGDRQAARRQCADRRRGGRVPSLWSERLRGAAHKAGGAQACLVAFDLLTLDAEDVRLRPIEERRAKLSGLIRGVDGEAIEAEGAVVFAHVCKLGLEGIVSKRAGSLYRSGGSRSWLKSKNPAFVRT
jgi:ATP-dependent DNA ligase